MGRQGPGGQGEPAEGTSPQAGPTGGAGGRGPRAGPGGGRYAADRAREPAAGGPARSGAAQGQGPRGKWPSGVANKARTTAVRREPSGRPEQWAGGWPFGPPGPRATALRCRHGGGPGAAVPPSGAKPRKGPGGRGAPAPRGAPLAGGRSPFMGRRRPGPLLDTRTLFRQGAQSHEQECP